jgi:hypothetical protein
LRLADIELFALRAEAFDIRRACAGAARHNTASSVINQWVFWRRMISPLRRIAILPPDWIPVLMRVLE